MIVLSAVLVLVGLALLIAGLVSTGLALIYASLGVTVVAAILLLLGVRMTPPKGGADTLAVPAMSDAPTGGFEALPVRSVADGLETVVVVSGRPRYHRAGCRFLANAGDGAEDITVQEARELGFTPCGVCKPDDDLHGRDGDDGMTAVRTAPAETKAVADPPAGPVLAADPDVAVAATMELAATDPPVAEDAPPATAPAETAAANDVPATKAPVRKAPVRKAAAKKAAVKKAAVKKATVKKAPVKKAPAKKTSG